MDKQVNFQGKSVTINGKLQVNGPVNSAQTAQVIAMLEAQVGKTAMASGDSLQLMQRISDMASDNVIMPEEKRALKREWDIITAEYTTVLAQATDGSSEEIAYMAKYAALLLYLYGTGGVNLYPLFDDLTVKSEWTGIGDEVRLVFKEYFVAREAVALGGLRAAVDPSGAKPDSITDIFPVANKDSIVITWAWPFAGLQNKIARHLIDVSYDEGDTWTRFVGSGNPTYTYTFDRAVDGYPEKTTVTTPGPVPLSKYRFRVRPENIYGYQAANYGPASTGKAVDVTNYGTWIPPVPVLVPYCNGREAVINWNDGKQYGKYGYDVQICKKDTLPSEGDWLKPEITEDARADETNYTDGTTGFFFVPVEQFSQTLPLLDQLVNTPKDTKYYYRVRGISSVPLSTDLTRTLIGSWTTGISVLARPTGTVDLVEKAISAAQIADGAVLAHTVMAENMVAINAKLGTLNGDTEDYKLVMSPGADDEDPEGTFLMGSDGSGATPADASYFRRWRENGLWRMALKLQSFFVDAIASKIVGRFQVMATSSAAPDLDVNPSTGEVKVGTSLDIGGSSATGTRLKIKESIGVGSIAFTGTGANDLSLLTDGTVPGVFEVKVKSAPQTWGEISNQSYYITKMVYGNSFFVAGFSNGDIYTSPDCVTWTDRGFVGVITALHYTGSLFILGLDTGVIYTSSNATTWTIKENISGDSIVGIASSGTAVVVVARYSRSYRHSADGVTWTTGTLPYPWYSTAAVAYINGNYIVSSSAGYTYTSPDRTTWTLRQTIEAIKAFVVYNSYLVAGSENGKIYTTTDGLTWTLRQTLDAAITSLTVLGSWAIAGLANGKIYTSTDLITWREKQTLGTRVYSLSSNGAIALASTDTKKVYSFTPQLFAWREITGSWSADLPLYPNYTYTLTGFDITFQFSTESDHVLNDLWEFTQEMQKGLSIQDSEGVEFVEAYDGEFKVNSVKHCSIIRPLTGTISANTTYTIPEGEAVYTCIIPKAYLVASSGGPYTLTLTTGVSGKETVVVPISRVGVTLINKSLNFNIYIDVDGNIISEPFEDIIVTDIYGTCIKESSGRMIKIMTESTLLLCTLLLNGARYSDAYVYAEYTDSFSAFYSVECVTPTCRRTNNFVYCNPYAQYSLLTTPPNLRICDGGSGSVPDYSAGFAGVTVTGRWRA